jgi:thiol-disulfide isomerase/thioredoxin
MPSSRSSPVRAPEIGLPGLTWFNVERPLDLAALRGKLVLLDFWTFCCINCMHILPILKRVEEAYPREVVVIGVHSPKFQAERDPANVARAIARYGVVHPVVHDPEFKIWKQYAIRAWPTLVFISPDGRLLGQNSGEPDAENLLEAVEMLVRGSEEAGLLKPSALTLKPEPVPARRLSFPGKLKPLPRADGPAHWALADSGHHQIAILDAEGKELSRIGSGNAGSADGALAAASFNAPQGLICADDAIYVADTGNHSLRKIDLKAGMVTTLAGTGARGMALGDAAPARTTALASPWDLELDGTHLYIANAGTHQLGVLDLDKLTVAALAGDSGEAIQDGPARGARLAQPSGLALSADRNALYFADSETSALRVVEDLRGTPRVRTLVGTGLFDFGHRNGPLAEAQFQHPLGLAVRDGGLLVADSYNAALRSIDLARSEAGDVDDGFLCEDPVCLPLAEPAGVASDGGRVLLVDTNNHRVLAYDLAKRTYRTWAD